MEKYKLTQKDIEDGVNRILLDVYASSTISNKPKLIYIVAGPGAGKTSVEAHFRDLLKKEDEKPYTLDSDKIAQFHPDYEEVVKELPEDGYRITRQFVRPVAPVVFDELMKKHISIINENVLNKGESDIEQAKKFKKNGYKVLVNVMATDLFESRLSCYERNAAMLLAGLTPRGASKITQENMYNCFVDEIRQLEQLGFCDEINVYIRGENINEPPVLKYSSKGGNENKYRDFYEAIVEERRHQREKLTSNPEEYFQRIEDAKKIIAEHRIKEELTNNLLIELEELKEDFKKEIEKTEKQRD